ncbi:hypothetical protein [Pontibacter sp. H249]|uniref:hypothetical protein n=1 Tax=Pontibacter sp. H249 TaxID=3133420 RepID=UPI0030C39963
MKNDKRIQQILGAKLYNGLGITLKEEAERLLPLIKRLSWYNEYTEELIDPNLISYYFLEHTPGSVFFCVMKQNGQEVDYSLLETYPEIDEVNYKLFVEEYVLHFNATCLHSNGKNDDVDLDLVVNLRDYKLSNLMDDL